MNYRYWVWFSFFIVGPLHASDRFKGVDLWMPTTYQKQYSKLLDAADKAKDDPYCFQLLSGRVLEAKSTIDHMQFYFRCRTEDRDTFSMQVDGNTLAVTNTYGERKRKIEETRLAEEELKKNLVKQLKDAESAKMLQEKVAARRKEQSKYWSVCRKEMRKRLKSFDKVSILSDSLPEPEVQADQLIYTVLFDSLSPSRKTLHFKIMCNISALDYFDVVIKPRKVIK
ncbi:MAG: hypothetical protein ACRBBR_06455 [Cellvibrionaceae bacterium]